MAKAVNWGIMGTGAIARKFASDLVALPGAKLLAVGSRSQTKADDFGREFKLTRCYPGYEELVSDSEVDAIYVATPHSCHKENTLLALAANKPVLVEKPFAINAREAEVVIRAAREKRLLVMEAMWTRFVPLYVPMPKHSRIRPRIAVPGDRPTLRPLLLMNCPGVPPWSPASRATFPSAGPPLPLAKVAGL